MPSIRVRALVAMPHRLYLDALSIALAGVDDIVIVAETTDALRTEELATRWRPEVVVLDSVLWRQSHAELVRALHANGVATVLLCGDDMNTPAESEPYDCPGEFVLINEPLEVLVEAIRTAGLDAAKRRPRMMTRLDDKPISILTDQEIEVLRLIAEGFATKDISKTLRISARTVENHRSHIVEKLDIRSSAGLARYAMRNGIVPP